MDNNEKYILNKTFQKKKVNKWFKKINPKISRKMKKEENLYICKKYSKFTDKAIL